jgi:hypothetical protein
MSGEHREVAIVDTWMTDQAGDPTRQLQFLESLVDANASVAGDILQIGTGAWAIHGSIPVDGEVLVARYDSWEDAVRVLRHLGPNHDDRAPSPAREPRR